MAYVFTLFIISVIGFVIYRMVKKKSIPSNCYTPDDDITMGKKFDIKLDSPLEDSKHNIQYEEKIENDKKG